MNSAQKRRKNKGKSKGSSPMTEENKFSCHFLMIIDEEPVRRKVHKEYQKVHKRLSEIEKQIESHEILDVPAYQNWLSKTFGPLLSELRELADTLNKRLQWLDLLESLYYGERLSPAAAYTKAVKIRDHPEEFQTEQGNDNDENDEDQGDDGTWKEDDDGLSEEERIFIDSFFEDGDPDAMKEAFENFVNGMLGIKPKYRPESQKNQNDIKECYRSIVRLLHPDRAGELTSLQKELWHQAQEAYQSQNIDMLQMVLARCEAGEAGVKSIDRLSIVVSMTRHIHQQIRLLQDKMSFFRRTPAWGFSAKNEKSLKKMEIKASGELIQETKSCRSKLNRVEDQIAFFEDAHKMETLINEGDKVPRKMKKKKVKPAPPDDPNQNLFNF